MKKKVLRNKQIYKGMGFVEALIAIMVTGVASVVLMGIAASTLRSLLNTEIQDKMSQLGRSGAVIAQGVADLDSEKLEEEKFFFNTGIEDNCFAYESDGSGGYSFNSTAGIPIDSNRSAYESKLVQELDENGDLIDEDKLYYFRVMCVEDIIEGSGITRPRALIKVITGYSKTEGNYTNTKDIKDYEYLAVINL